MYAHLSDGYLKHRRVRNTLHGKEPFHLNFKRKSKLAQSFINLRWGRCRCSHQNKRLSHGHGRLIEVEVFIGQLVGKRRVKKGSHERSNDRQLGFLVSRTTDPNYRVFTEMLKEERQCVLSRIRNTTRFGESISSRIAAVFSDGNLQAERKRQRCK